MKTETWGFAREQLLRKLGGETEFVRKHQSGARTLAAFEHSEYIDDWRELMRLYLVRRTRSFIMENYAETDPIRDGSFSPSPMGPVPTFLHGFPKR